MPKYLVKSPFGDSYSVTVPEGATEQDAITYVQKQLGMYEEPTDLVDLEGPSSDEILASAPIQRGFGRALTRGVSRGMSRMGSIVTDIIPGMAGSMVGADEYARQQMEEAAAKEMALQQTNPTQFKSFRDVDSLGEILPFLGETIGEQGANIATAIGTGGAGSIVGRTVAKRAAQKQIDDIIAARVAEQAARTQVAAPTVQEAVEAAAQPGVSRLLGTVGARGAERGAIAGAFGASAGLNAPEIFQNIYENTGELAPAVSIFGGAFAGALDSILPLQVLRMFKTTPVDFQKEVIRKIGERKGLNSALADYSAKTALGIGKAAATEAATEGTQEAISIAAEKFVQDGEQFWNSEDFDRLLEAGVRGAVGGGAFGALPGARDAARIRGIEAQEFARREPIEEPIEEPTGEEIDETLPPAINAGPIAGQRNISPVPVPSPAGSRLGGPEVPKILPGLNEEVAPEVRNAELTDEDISELIRQGAEEENLIDTTAEEEDVANISIKDIEKEKKEAISKGKPAPGEPLSAAPQTLTLPTRALALAPAPAPAPILQTPPTETPAPAPAPILQTPPTETPASEVKTITPDTLALPNIPKTSVLKPLLIGKPYGTPQANEELRNAVLAKTKNPVQIKHANTIFENIGVPTIDLTKSEKAASKKPSIAPTAPTPFEFITPTSDVGFLGGKELLSAAIERDQNAYTAIERLAGRQTAVDQYLGDKYVGKVKEREALPYSGPVEQSQFETTLTDMEKASVRERLKGMRDAARRRERVVAEKESEIEAATPEAQAELEEIRAEEGAFEDLTTAIPELEKVTSKRAEYERLREDAESLVGNTPKGDDPLRYLTVAEKSIPDRKERAPVSRFKNFLKKPENEEFLNELRLGFARTKRAPDDKKKAKTTPEIARETIKKLFGRDPQNEDITFIPDTKSLDVKKNLKNVQGLAEIGGEQAWFLTENIPQGKEFSVFMHEVGTHVGMERLVGKTNYNYLINKIYEWAILGKGGELEVSIAKAAMARIPKNTKKEVVRDEAIAYFVTVAIDRGINPKAIAKVNSPLGTFFRYIMQGIKDILRQIGMPGYEPTTQDIVDIAYGAAHLTYKRADDVRAKAAKEEGVKAKAAKEEGVKASDLPKAAAFMERPIAYAVNSPSNPVGGKALASKISDAIASTSPSAKEAIKSLHNNYSGLSNTVRSAYVSLLSVTQLADLAEVAKLPNLAAKIKEISTISTSRDVAITNKKREIEKFLLRARKITAKYAPKVVNELYDFMHESSILGVKFDIDKRIAAAQKAGNTVLEGKLLSDRANMQKDPESAKLYIKFEAFEKKYPELSKLYYELRDRYKAFSDEFLDTVNQPDVLGPAGKIINDLMKNQIDPYFPLYRRGDYWVRFTDKDGKEGVSAFETEIDAREFITFAKQNGAVIDKGPYMKPTERQLAELMPTKQVQEIIKLLNEKKASPELMESVYSIYLNLFPNQSIMQAFRKRKGIQGYRQDALANFADVGTRMAINIEQFKTTRRLDSVLNDAITIAEDEGSPIMNALATSLRKREAFLKNPVQKGIMGAVASTAGHNAYRWFILGNISSAIINTLQLPIIVAPLLGGKFGWGEATAALREATALYFRGGYDDNTSVISPFTNRNLSDRSFAGAKSKLTPEQKRLFENAIQRGAVRRTTGQDLMEIREFGALDPADKFGYKKMQVEMSLGWMFQNAERFNREVTLLAAYNLARKKKMSEEEATEYALSTVEFAHGSAMSELGPQMFQTGPMKIIGVFKRFALNQIYLQYKLFREMFKGASPDVQKEARNQLLGIYATSFAFAGVKGVPIYGLFNIAASMFMGIFGDDDEPFDLDEWVLSTFGNEIFRGPIGAATNLNIATRTGFGDLLWRPDEKRLADIGLLNYAMEQAAGPAFGVAANIIKGATLAYEGDWQKGLETGLPSGLKSLMRGYRFATEGVVNSKGFKIVDDPNAYDVMMSAIGFSPNDLNDAYARVSIMKKIERRVQEQRNGLLDTLWAAREAGDYSGIRDVQKEIDEYNKSKFGRNYQITPETKEKSYDMRKARQREAERTFGTTLNPRLREAARQEAGILE